MEFNVNNKNNKNVEKFVFNTKQKYDYNNFRCGECFFRLGDLYALGAVTNPFRIKQVIFNSPATIVYWEDGTKTVVKAYDEPFDREKGLAMAISKKALGNKGNFNEVFKKYIQ